MFANLTKNYKVMFDLSGPDRVELNSEFIRNVNTLLRIKDTAFINNRLQKYLTESFTPIRTYYFPQKATQFIEKNMKTTVNNVLIISNNIDNVKYLAEYGYNLVYLQTEYVPSYEEHQYLPTAIWTRDEFYNFCQKQLLTSTYASERIGFPDTPSVNGGFKTIEKTYDLPKDGEENTRTTFDLVLTGPYYPTGDYRHFNHPLSQAIIGLKRGYYYETKVTKEMFARLIESFVTENDEVDHITFVPPRPGNESRFMGVEDYLNEDISIEYDLLHTIKDYKTPKKSRDLQDKYKHITGQIASDKEISGHVLLLDDVFTSGATTVECSRILYEQGADHVTVLPLAFTQDFEQTKQWVVPAVFDENGNEFRIRFNKNHEVYYESRTHNENTPTKASFDQVNEQFIMNLGRDVKNLPKRFCENQMAVDAVIFDLDDTLLTTSHLAYYRINNQPVRSKEKLAKVDYIINPKELAALQEKNIRVGIVTRSPRRYAESLLEEFPIPHNYMVTAWEVLKGKPAADPILKCAKKIGAAANYSLYVGDSDYDELAAHRAGALYAHIDQVIEKDMLATLIPDLLDI